MIRKLLCKIGLHCLHINGEAEKVVVWPKGCGHQDFVKKDERRRARYRCCHCLKIKIVLWGND